MLEVVAVSSSQKVSEKVSYPEVPFIVRNNIFIFIFIVIVIVKLFFFFFNFLSS